MSGNEQAFGQIQKVLSVAASGQRGTTAVLIM
jgi:hypothetical protein